MASKSESEFPKTFVRDGAERQVDDAYTETAVRFDGWHPKGVKVEAVPETPEATSTPSTTVKS